MDERYIVANVLKFIPRRHILFITAQDTSISSDVDIYCVISNKIKSQVHIFRDGNKQVEVFIDSWDDMVQKIKNFDEIVVSFIMRMKLIADNGYYKKAKSLVKKKFHLPKNRLSLLQYRIAVIGSKYISAKDPLSRSFFKGQVISYLVLALLEKHGIWPQSPKRWIEQLKALNTADAKIILDAIQANADLTKVIKRFADGFKEIHLIKEGKDNKLTYLG